MKARVDQSSCVGAAECTRLCPEVFELVNGKSHVQVETVPNETVHKCRQAAQQCPVQAIKVEE
jgi:ferredoxin